GFATASAAWEAATPSGHCDAARSKLTNAVSHEARSFVGSLPMMTLGAAMGQGLKHRCLESTFKELSDSRDCLIHDMEKPVPNPFPEHIAKKISTDFVGFKHFEHVAELLVQENRTSTSDRFIAWELANRRASKYVQEDENSVGQYEFVPEKFHS